MGDMAQRVERREGERRDSREKGQFETNKIKRRRTKPSPLPRARISTPRCAACAESCLFFSLLVFLFSQAGARVSAENRRAKTSACASERGYSRFPVAVGAAEAEGTLEACTAWPREARSDATRSEPGEAGKELSEGFAADGESGEAPRHASPGDFAESPEREGESPCEANGRDAGLCPATGPGAPSPATRVLGREPERADSPAGEEGEKGEAGETEVRGFSFTWLRFARVKAWRRKPSAPRMPASSKRERGEEREDEEATGLGDR